MQAARPSRHALFLPTLFDRLCDDAPGEAQEAPGAYAAGRTQLRAIVQCDLSLLLNSTDLGALLDAARYPQAARSGANYGLAPLAGGWLTERRWADIEARIRHAILCFEPRLLPDTLRVRPLPGAQHNLLPFEIAGEIAMQPYPLELRIQSRVDLESSRIELQAGREPAAASPARMPAPSTTPGPRAHGSAAA